MRLINQSLCMDVPYEKTTLRIRESTILAVVSRAYMPDGAYEIVMGRYSTEEKAYKVMEMVRNDYLKIMRIENGSSIQGLYDIPKVFIFPKDEDVEV